MHSLILMRGVSRGRLPRLKRGLELRLSGLSLPLDEFSVYNHSHGDIPFPSCGDPVWSRGDRRSPDVTPE
jgi:hypothetical protein